jgi:hypothetical protein
VRKLAIGAAVTGGSPASISHTADLVR